MSSPEPSSSQRRANRARVVRALRERGALSRSELAEIGLSRSTVKSVVDELIDAGTIVEVAGGRDARNTGRPPTLVGLQGYARGGGRRRDRQRGRPGGGLQHRAGTAAARLSAGRRPHAAGGDAQDGGHADRPHARSRSALARPTSSASASRCRDRSSAAPESTVGPPRSSPGSTSTRTHGRARSCSCRCVVDNDANLAALAEMTWGAARGLRDVAYVYTASGIGAGFVLNGALYLGANGTAGELGHTTIDENGVVCECGGRGCLNTLANADAITQNLWRSHRDRLSIADVIKLAQMGDVGLPAGHRRRGPAHRPRDGQHVQPARPRADRPRRESRPGGRDPARSAAGVHGPPCDPRRGGAAAGRRRRPGRATSSSSWAPRRQC